jgi:hypothetical protein
LASRFEHALCSNKSKSLSGRGFAHQGAQVLMDRGTRGLFIMKPCSCKSKLEIDQ